MRSMLSPRELSEALGVSESSVKRWVDQGVISASRTAGGHRRIPVEEALRFIRKTERELPRPDVLGLGAALAEPLDGAGWNEAFAEALESGDGPMVRRLVWAMHLHGVSAAAICDGPIRTGMERIADDWRDRQDAVFREHRATDLCVQALSHLRALAPASDAGPLAVGGAPAGDPYLLPSMMVAAVLGSVGYLTCNLGPDTPEAAFARSADVTGMRPSVVWLSLTATDLSRAEVEGARRLALALASEGVTVVVGGRSRHLLDPLPEAVLQIDSMTQLLDELEAAARPASLSRPVELVRSG